MKHRTAWSLGHGQPCFLLASCLIHAIWLWALACSEETTRNIASDALDLLDTPSQSDMPEAMSQTTQLELTVMTYNVLCSFCDPSYDPWDERLHYQRDIILRHAPDLIGLQELSFKEEVDEYLALNPEYEAIYFTTDDPDAPFPAYPDETILYLKARFKEISRGFFWLSPTPDEPFSIGFSDGKAQLWRLVGYVLFEDKDTGRRFYFANTHFDPNHPSQEKSVPLVYERFSDLVTQHPVIFTGDFNLDPGEPAFNSLTQGIQGYDWHFTLAYDIAQKRIIVTNQQDQGSLDDRGRGIDLILLAGGDFVCPYWKVDYMTYGERHLYPSDHFAISARVILK